MVFVWSKFVCLLHYGHTVDLCNYIHHATLLLQKYSLSPFQTAVSCTCNQPPDVPNATPSSPPYNCNSEITYTCNPGYSMVGNNRIFCVQGSQFNGDLPQCQAVQGRFSVHISYQILDRDLIRPEARVCFVPFQLVVIWYAKMRTGVTICMLNWVELFLGNMMMQEGCVVQILVQLVVRELNNKCSKLSSTNTFFEQMCQRKSLNVKC